MPRSFLARATVAAALTLALTSTAQVAFSTPMTGHLAAVTKVFSKSPTPTISGHNAVGAVIRAVAGTWKPGHVTLHYQWLSNGHPVSHATSSRFTVRGSDAGKRVAVSVTGTENGYRAVTRVSKAIAIPAPRNCYTGTIDVSTSPVTYAAPVLGTRTVYSPVDITNYTNSAVVIPPLTLAVTTPAGNQFLVTVTPSIGESPLAPGATDYLWAEDDNLPLNTNITNFIPLDSGSDWAVRWTAPSACASSPTILNLLGPLQHM